MRLTNNTKISIAMAVWLAHDEYSNTSGSDEPIPEGKIISTTTLLRPTRQVVLAQRISPEEQELDIVDLIASRLGHALHSSVEDAWRHHYASSLMKLGYPKAMIDRIIINPKPEDLKPDTIPVYLEQRRFKKFGDYVISGQLDQIIDGSICDTKSTSTFSFTAGNKDEDYAWQLSIYRWLNPEKVTSNVARINFIFTDWLRYRALQDPNYPQKRVEEIQIELHSLEETEAYIAERIKLIERNKNLSEPEIVRCTDKELWRGDTVYKYYSDPSKVHSGGRATKNFDTDKAAANKHLSEMGKGIVVEFPGKVKACAFCNVFDICSQQKEYEHDRS